MLIGVEYAAILERSKRSPNQSSEYAQNHVTNTEAMLKTIIHPLERWAGIEAFQDTIKFTTSELSNGSLLNPREVEVSLISNGKVSSARSTIWFKID